MAADRRRLWSSRSRIPLRDEDQPGAIGWNVGESVRSRFVDPDPDALVHRVNHLLPVFTVGDSVTLTQGDLGSAKLAGASHFCGNYSCRRLRKVCAASRHSCQILPELTASWKIPNFPMVVTSLSSASERCTKAALLTLPWVVERGAEVQHAVPA